MKKPEYTRQFPTWASLIVLPFIGTLWLSLREVLAARFAVVIPLLLVVPVSTVIIEFYRIRAVRMGDDTQAEACWLAIRIIAIVITIVSTFTQVAIDYGLGSVP